MDKKVILAVAGSGKTTRIINSLDVDNRILIITYTTANQNNIKIEIIKQFGFLPSNISIYGVHEFLFSFCLKPLCKNFISGINFNPPNYFNKHDFDSLKRIYSNRISKHILSHYNPVFLDRINKYFDIIYVDEMQDLASDDFDIFMNFSKLKIPVFLIGDFYQHTFSTSVRGPKGKGTYDNIDSFKKKLLKNNYIIDSETLSGSHRCAKNICSFISETLKIPITSLSNEDGDIQLVEKLEDIDSIMSNNSIKKLFYQKHYTYTCNSNNWGNSKGDTYDEICVVLNPTTFSKFKTNSLDTLASSTLAKFYVACTRSRKNVWFIDEKLISEKYKIKIKIDG